MRLRAALLVLLVVGVAVAIGVVVSSGPDDNRNLTRPSTTTQSQVASVEKKPGEKVPVPTNRNPNVPDGFRGDVHPLLTGQTRLDVTAHWSPVGKGRDRLDKVVHPTIYSWFTSLKPAEDKHTYTERDLSAFLPAQVGEAGQVWAVEEEKVAPILRQFHPRPSMHVVAQGRRAGPDGVFALLRAVSLEYLDIVFRAHAEFYLTPPDWPSSEILVRAWYTPAYFTGRVLVNRRTGTVDYFRLALPTEKSLNVHLTAAFQDVSAKGDAHDIVRVERMELVGGEPSAAEKVVWSSEVTPAEADTRLARVFFKFREINWLAFDQVAERAHASSRPIFAIVSWGSFDDQSC